MRQEIIKIVAPKGDDWFAHDRRLETAGASNCSYCGGDAGDFQATLDAVMPMRHGNKRNEIALLAARRYGVWRQRRFVMRFCLSVVSWTWAWGAAMCQCEVSESE